MHTKKTYLKIKICSLQEEARIIRREEQRWIIGKRRNHPIRMGLMFHRKWDVRREQRSALLAYGYLRGRRYKQLEAKCFQQPNWDRIIELIAKYGTTTDKKAIGEQLRIWRGN